MYHQIVKRQVRRGFQALSAGKYDVVLRQFAPRVSSASRATTP